MQKEEFKKYVIFLKQCLKYESFLNKCKKFDIECINFLKSRGLNKEDFEGIVDFYGYSGPLEYKGKIFNISKSIIIPIYKNDLVVGLWVRSLTSKQFFILTNELTTKYIFSKSFDNKKPYYICESILDAIALGKLIKTKNIIALSGVSINKDILNENAIICLDNDRTGLINSLKYIDYNIMLIENKQKDFNDVVKNNEKLKYKIVKGILAKVKISNLI